jgi:hypothetical protein
MEKHRNRKVVNATHKIEKREIQLVDKVGTELRWFFYTDWENSGTPHPLTQGPHNPSES